MQRAVRADAADASETARRNTNLFRSVVREDADETPYAEHLIHRLSDGRHGAKQVGARRSRSSCSGSGCGAAVTTSGRSTGGDRPGRLRPDFTFIDAAGDPIIWEHLGMLDKESYRASWEWKLEWYTENDFVLGKNLFTTEDDPAGGLDQGELTRVATGDRRASVEAVTGIPPGAGQWDGRAQPAAETVKLTVWPVLTCLSDLFARLAPAMR